MITLSGHANRENEEVRLPVMVCQDGFITSHAVENIELLEDQQVKDFVGEYTRKLLIKERKSLCSGSIRYFRLLYGTLKSSKQKP